MAKRDMIVIGASAGGIEPLKQVVAGFPADLDAAVFVVLHLPPWYRSELSEILSHAGPLPAEPTVSGRPVEPGRIYVAQPDYHLLLNGDGLIELWRGPRENSHRPAINATFRSAAVGYRDRVIGVVLSGMLDDGTTGLWWIKHFGGLTIVQDPREAAFSEMPAAALNHVDVDHVVSAREMGGLIARLTNGTSEVKSGEDEDERE